MVNKISILHWTTTSFSLNSMGGVERMEYEWLNYFNSRGIQTKLYVPRLNGENSDIIALKHFDKLMKYDFCYYRKFLTEAKNSIIIASNSPLLAIFQKNIIVFFHNYIKYAGRDGFLPFYTLFKNRYKKSFYFFCSEFLRNNFLTTYKEVPKEKTAVVYNGVADKEIIKVSRQEFSSPIKIVYVGQWNYGKGFDILLDAFKKLEQNHFPVKLYLIGGANLWQNKKNSSLYKRYSTLINNNPNIINLGKLSNNKLLKFLVNMDLLIMPSRYQEGLGITSIEGLAKGVIVISSGAGGQKEIIQDNKTGYLFQSGSVDSLYQAIKKVLLKEKTELNKLRESGFIIAKNKFNNAINFQLLLDKINHLYGSEDKKLFPNS